MQTLLGSTESSYGISFALEKIDSIELEGFKPFFRELPVDPFIKGKYRFRRLSRFKVVGNELIKQPHGYLFQSKQYNPLVGDVKREFAELDDALGELDGFKKLVLEFRNYCKLSSGVEIGVHQIRTTCSPNNFGNPAPEGIHRDGCEFIGIFSVDRENISGGETHLYVAKKEKPVFKKVLRPGELLLLNDRDFFHFTTPIKPTTVGEGTRDVFVVTYPSLLSD
ncbi:2OG-Fe dioxygenase family protein [Aerosakkonema funiforme]|uniref:2OG-Fe dioxygenase family protein n=1 Tax=Aerosakkonema funiforme FACHB-1375 TaxID=2949571 RepID=A0A926VBR1_9CYAN|nr:2OG-Fe dioxygenase family protein [Aerosakkonema funiforme]MBD2180883.1 2OG-Fe dioxygenase family protein [Aerosakkonema funiforme FACHB-1375]